MYLEPTDSDAFVDFPKLEIQDWMENYVECPKCFGHGGWNLKLNSYPLHKKENTPENRHLFSHFRASCVQCHGYGYVSIEDAEHIHQWEKESTQGNCLNLYNCTVCGKKMLVDSSD